ncbi:2-hydroxyacid dehydrogenase [Flavobacterium sp. NKUCC04_CG]|uniref:2-hydroxyacid dehydrogenase n=1 Tax=Flavobacterium sp. NKUCC04_CG TaxID=2842121 RepID=UPI001C5B986B|nr:2-hydroxyacid dehydrogenase [Flavobacterium sp. NKUCC04_CG]MBW3519923.1 2-hydroxyacid dehydrogenase [Flavobacterium sp. NKUCC04_CG]
MKTLRTSKILHLDSNHPLMMEQLHTAGFINDFDYTSSKEAIELKIAEYDGIVIRSRFRIDRNFIDAATRLKFIARVGAGLENINCDYALSKNITLIAAPEGNSTAVGEHAMGMLLSLMNKLNIVDREVRQGIWIREANRGVEIEGKTVGIIGYGHMGKAFAQRLKGFNCKVICYDIQDAVGNENATQVSLEQFQREIDILSLHTPETPETINLINKEFLSQLSKPIYLINTARGKSVNTADLVACLESGIVLGAGLDVLEYEKSSFENMFQDQKLPEPLQYLIQSDRVLLSPHIAGWTIESKEKLAQVITDKIKALQASFLPLL